MALLLSLGGAAAADRGTFREVYSEKYACRWDCPFDIPSIPGLDRDDLREELCDRICAERLRVTVSLKLVLTLPALRHVDLRSVPDFRLAAGNLEFPLAEMSKSSSNSITFPQYRQETNDYGKLVLKKAGTVKLSKRADVLTISASRVTGGDSAVAGQFTHHTGTLHQAINLGQLPVRVGLGEMTVEREIEFKALTTIKTNLVRVEIEDEFEDEFEDEREVTKELRTFSTVKASGVASWGNPQVDVTTPAGGQRWSNEVITASGTVVSASEGPTVLLQFNGAEEWIEIAPSNGVWSAPLPLQPGTNRLFVFARDGLGRFSPGVLVQFVHVRSSPMRLEILPDSTAGSVTGVTDGQLLEEGVVYRLTPVPAPGQLLEKWVLESPAGGVREITSVTAPVLAFRHEANLLIRAHFVPNRFLGIPSQFAGLVRLSSGTNDSAVRLEQGLINLQFTTSGALQGRYVTAGGKFSFRSQIHPVDGTAHWKFLPGKDDEALASLEFDLEHGQWVTGSLTNQVGWVAVVEAYPVASSGEVTPLVGTHTFVIPGADLLHAASLPAGFGSGSLKVSRDGSVTGRGVAGDGTKLVFNAPLVKSVEEASPPRYFWPLFHSERKGAIRFRGFIEISSTNTFDAGSPFHWVKQPNFRDALYPAGFGDAQFAAAGGLREWVTARYIQPGRGTNTPGFINGRLTFSGGNLTAPVQIPIAIAPNDKVVIDGLNPTQLKLQFTRSTGAFSGTFLHPQNGSKTKLAGIILQSAGNSPGRHLGYGWFLGSTQSGAILLEENLVL